MSWFNRFDDPDLGVDVPEPESVREVQAILDRQKLVYEALLKSKVRLGGRTR